MDKAKFGIIGLAVMGQNLARNVARNKFPTVVYNRTTETMDAFIAEHGNEYLAGEAELKNFVEKIERPRSIMLMVKAGDAVDSVIESLIPLLEEGDVIIDGGNSFYKDTQRRAELLNKKSIHYVGSGVSGGEEGALNGPSLMPGGSEEGWKVIQPIFEAIAAKDFSGDPCVTYIGKDGAGHYIKMVHNGIEYGVMQLMAEGYEILRSLYGLDAKQIGEIYGKYNEGKLKSFLFEIAVPVLTRGDDETGTGYLIDHILDKAGQKGTGKWTSIDALDRGIPLSTLTEAVFARTVSSQQEKRVRISKLYTKNAQESPLSLDEFTVLLEDALYASMLSCYAQGYDLIQTAAKEEGWDIDLAEISRIWEGGCIIRSVILNFLHKAYGKADASMHMFEIGEIVSGMSESVPSLRKVSSLACEHCICAAGLTTALAYFESMTSEKTSANLIQGLRDYFGAHTYERIDKKGSFHTEWLS